MHNWQRRCLQRLCIFYTNPFSVIFVSVKSLRSISPFISFLLIIIVLSGSMGFTLIRHTCHHCGVEKIITSLTTANADDKCCCAHDRDVVGRSYNTGEYVFAHDCCSLETERMVTDQVVCTKVQSEIMPYFMTAIIKTIIPDFNFHTVRLFANVLQMHDDRDLTTLHCQIQS